MYTEQRIDRARVLWRSTGSTASVLPADGCLDLILRDGAVHVAGPSTHWLTTQDDRAEPTVGVRFAPGVPGGLLRVDPAELRDAFLPLADVVGRRSARAFADQLRRLDASSPSSAERGALAGATEGWVEVVREYARGGRPVAAVIEELSWSERRLRRSMAGTFGYGYTALVRIERARRARSLLAGGWSPAEAAALAGYADQPHLTREFRRLVGVTPRQFADSAA